MQLILAFISLLLLAISCTGSKAHSLIEESRNETDTASFVLPVPVPPENMSAQRRNLFMADRYWDAMDWSDSLFIGSDRIMGESMATYGVLLSSLPEVDRVKSVNAFINRISDNAQALKRVSEYAFSYFYYPGAPQYDAELYFPFIAPLLASNNVDAAERARLEDRSKQIKKNRIGAAAADFDYIDSAGNLRQLLSTSRNAGVRIIMLYDPDCNVCDEAISILTSSPKFNDACHTGDAAVIAINAYGQEGGGRARPKTGMPGYWTIGYSPKGEVDEKEIYVIRSTPAIYIIDSDGKVLEKDISLARLSQLVN